MGGGGPPPAPAPPPPPAFDIRTVNRFDPGQSLSFARELFETFALSYADTSLLTGTLHPKSSRKKDHGFVVPFLPKP